MKTYFDQNRLVKETDRRFHATDIELSGGFIQIVPAVAARLTPQVRIGAWSFTESTLSQAEQIETDLGNAREVRRIREQRWWARQWRQRNGLFRVRQLNRAEDALAQRLLGPEGMPPDCFPRAEGSLADDNDAQIVAQVIAVGGTLLISSNLVMIRDRKLQEWFDKHHNEWPGVQARKLVQRVDPWFSRWWHHERGPTVFTRTALAAFWPESPGASPELVRAHAEEGLSAMAPRALHHVRPPGTRPHSTFPKSRRADRDSTTQPAPPHQASRSRAQGSARSPVIHRARAHCTPQSRPRHRRLPLVMPVDPIPYPVCTANHGGHRRPAPCRWLPALFEGCQRLAFDLCRIGGGHDPQVPGHPANAVADGMAALGLASEDPPCSR